MPRTRIAAVVLLCLAGIFLSLLLLSKHYGVPLFGEAVLAACGIGEGCDIVAQSRYSSLWGLPLAAWGVFFYGALLGLVTPGIFTRSDEGTDSAVSLGFYLVAVAIVLDVMLLGLQAFVIKAFCKFCIGTYVVNLLALAALWPFRQAGQAMNFLFVARERRGLAAWAMTLIAVAATAMAGNAALADRKALASSSILGVPTMLQAPVKAEPETRDEALTKARAEAAQLKAILDNPVLLQNYLTQKAKDDFNKSAAVAIDLRRAPSQGGDKAPIAVASFSDFMCPFCRDLALGLRSFLKNAGTSVRIHYKQFPLDTTCNPQIGRTVHPGSCELAKGSLCAAESGRFWEYHDKVFGQTWDTATKDDVLRISESVGLDRARMNACMDSAATRGRLTADIEEGVRLGVGSTPTVFVNGHKLPSVNVFFLAVDEERKRLNLPPFTGNQPVQGK